MYRIHLDGLDGAAAAIVHQNGYYTANGESGQDAGVKHNKMLLTNIIDKTAVIYRKENPFKNSKKFVDGVVHTHSVLSPCMHSPHSTHHEAVTTCFDKLETFLTNKANSKCAWEIVHVKTREMLQRLAHFTSRRRR
ncbi:uncharacterized protein [Lepisosteus oculatus]|uniref:uncharacterized protein n=1 Tax=Lepisosteus oculatus TaxID=7918 RepID=UPI00371C1519